MIGSLLQGKFSDRYGRRATLLVALWIVTIFSFATATLGNSFFAFCGLRLLTGLGMGALLPLGVTYVNEYAPRRLANTFSMWGWALGWAAGGIVAAAVGVYLTPIFGWQALYYSASLSIMLVVVCHVALPESLQFSAMRGNWQGIVQVLCRLNPSQAARYTAAGRKIHVSGTERSPGFGVSAAVGALPANDSIRFGLRPSLFCLESGDFRAGFPRP